MDKPKRPRINLSAKMVEALTVKDELEFKECLGSKNARRIISFVEKIELDIWYDKHYVYRSQSADESGKQRDVPLEEVQSLVQMSFKHLLLYSSKVNNFSFLNHELKGQRALRIVIKDSHSYSTKSLCIACEIHFVNFNRYEITVKTAIDGELHMWDGQFMVEMVDQRHSILYKFQQKKLMEIYQCQD